MGRQNRTRVVGVRLTDAEWSLVQDFAASSGITPSELMRRAARLAGGLGPTFEGDTRTVIESVLVQMRGVATNINQMARAMNSGRVPDDERLRDGFGQLLELLREAREAYGSLCNRAQAAVAPPDPMALHVPD